MLNKRKIYHNCNCNNNKEKWLRRIITNKWWCLARKIIWNQLNEICIIPCFISSLSAFMYPNNADNTCKGSTENLILASIFTAISISCILSLLLLSTILILQISWIIFLLLQYPIISLNILLLIFLYLPKCSIAP